MDVIYNKKLAAALIGRRLRANAPVQTRWGKPMLAFWGEDVGISRDDIHAHRAYRIYLDYEADGIITDVTVVVEGDLISPCSGYRMEALDEFDFAPVLQWCLNQTEPSERGSSVVPADDA